MNLSKKKCMPCSTNVAPLRGESIDSLLSQISQEWQVVEEHHLEREYQFKNFKEALEFTNKVGDLAEKEGHHPDIFLSWGKVVLRLFTHKIKGLSDADFIFAAKCDRLS